jgi:dipeptidase
VRKSEIGRTAVELVLALAFVFAASLSSATAQPYQTSVKAPDAIPEDTCVTCQEGPTGGCTSIMVGKDATTDGSVITAHTCDGNYRTWLDIVPPEQHRAGATRPVYWGKLHNETPWDMRGLRLKGEIPQADSTFAFFNVAYPAMNEKGLSIGETTIGGRNELRNPEGMFLIENLQAITLERTTTARDAIKLIGELVAEYGYGDWGECLTFADANEVWHFEIQGAGPLEIGAVWAAVRIPDDHVGVSANIPRIAELDLDNPDFYMASENVHSLAEEMGWWDPSSGEQFKFWKAYSGRTPFSIREFFILSTMAPDLNLLRDADELPFSVKPNREIDVREVMRYYRETYEGTEYDMTRNLMVQPQQRRGQEATEQVGMVKSPLVNNWTVSGQMANLLNTLKPGTVEPQRAIAIARCSYSQIIQNRGWLPPEIGTVAWFSFDNPGQSPRMPIFAGTTELPNSFAVCGQHSYREDAAVWWFRRTNRLAMIKWGEVREIIEGASMEFEDRAFAELPSIESIAMEYYNNGQYDQFRSYITKYSNDFAHATMAKWWELGNDLWTRYARGF